LEQNPETLAPITRIHYPGKEPSAHQNSAILNSHQYASAVISYSDVKELTHLAVVLFLWWRSRRSPGKQSPQFPPLRHFSFRAFVANSRPLNHYPTCLTGRVSKS